MPNLKLEKREGKAVNEQVEKIELYRPSNATEGECFMSKFCYQCSKDNPATEDYCPIILRTMMLDVDEPNYPIEWQYINDKPVCTAYTPLSDDE